MFADDTAIERVALGVLDRTLPKQAWTHSAHFAAALWFCRHRQDIVNPERMRGLISGYNEATGTENTDAAGYHHTITVASLRAAIDYLAGYSEDTSLCVVLADLMASRYGRADWLLTYWSRERLFSVAARKGWVEPDLLPLPF